MTHRVHVLAERRRARRRCLLDEHGITAVRVRPGCDAVLIDVSAGGALVQSAHRLMPGSSIDLQLFVWGRRLLVRGRVLRCEVAALGSAGPIYCGALNFDRPLAWLTDGARSVYRVPPAEDGTFADERGAATPHSPPQRVVSSSSWNVS